MGLWADTYPARRERAFRVHPRRVRRLWISLLKREVEAQRGDYGQLLDLARIDFGIDRIKLHKPLVAAAIYIEYLHVKLAGSSSQLERATSADIEAVIGLQAGAVALDR